MKGWELLDSLSIKIGSLIKLFRKDAPYGHISLKILKTLHENDKKTSCLSDLFVLTAAVCINIENLPSKRKFRNSSYSVRKKPFG